jgi:catalase-peroxidase
VAEVGAASDVYEGRDRKSGQVEVDGDLGRPRLRLELAAARDRRGLRELRRRQGEVRQDFVAAWTKVMNLDRFDLRSACGRCCT